MRNRLRSIKTAYIDTSALLILLSDYKKPRDAILRMIKNGELIRLKNGVYLIQDNIAQGTPFEQVANFLYGPSYVSREWALSFYGMIPEKVYTITSMTLGRNKEYKTEAGNFSYYTLPVKCYPIGIVQKTIPDFPGHFLIASPEKALADLVFKTSNNLSKEELKLDLIESKRVDINVIRTLDKELLFQIAESYHTSIIYYLRDIVYEI